MKLTKVTSAVATVLVVAAIAPVAPSVAATSKPAQIRIAYQAIPNADLLVKHSKALEKAMPGTKILWSKFESGGDVNTAAIAGAVDIGLAGSSPVTRGLSAPLNINYSVLWIHDVIGAAESLAAKPGINSVAALKGKKIATPFASTSHFSLLAALKEAGLNQSDVTLIDLEPADIQAAWERGDIDAAYVWSPTLDVLKTTGKVLVTSAKLAQKGYPTYDLAVVTNAFKKKYPAAVQTWLKVQDAAVKKLQTNPASAAKQIAPELGLTPAEVLTQIKGLVFLNAKQQISATYFGTTKKPGAFAKGLLKAATFLKSVAKIDSTPSLKTLQSGIDLADLTAATK